MKQDKQKEGYSCTKIQPFQHIKNEFPTLGEGAYIRLLYIYKRRFYFDNYFKKKNK